jgi:hypothetical protein
MHRGVSSNAFWPAPLGTGIATIASLRVWRGGKGRKRWKIGRKGEIKKNEKGWDWAMRGRK